MQIRIQPRIKSEKGLFKRGEMGSKGERMTESTQDELYEKAQSLIGKWIYDKDNPNEYLYAYDCFKSKLNDNDVVLGCIALRDGDSGYQPYITDKDVWMSEFKEFYRMVKGNKGIKTWEKIKNHYDGIFKKVKE